MDSKWNNRCTKSALVPDEHGSATYYEAWVLRCIEENRIQSHMRPLVEMTVTLWR